jgi:hypothetical protein
MTRIARVGAYALTFVAGCAIGGYVGFRVSESQVLASEMAQIAHYSAYLDAQRTSGNAAAYEEALRGYLMLLDAHSRGTTPLLSDRVYAVDSALTYARLSVLAANRGAKEEAQQYLTKASTLCPRLGWKECSSKEILEMARHLDRNRPLDGVKAQ